MISSNQDHRRCEERGSEESGTCAGFWTFGLTKLIRDLLALGFACHFGLGLFRPLSAGNSMG